jgi:hypothetical protein
LEGVFSIYRFGTYSKKENSRPGPAVMDQRQYSPPNKEKGDHSKEIASESHSTPARKCVPKSNDYFAKVMVSDETEVTKTQYPRLYLYACTI